MKDKASEKPSFLNTLKQGISSLIGRGKKTVPSTKDVTDAGVSETDLQTSDKYSPTKTGLNPLLMTTRKESNPTRLIKKENQGKNGTNLVCRVKDSRATRMMLRDNFEDLVTSLTGNSIPYIRKYAATKLGDLGDKKAIEYLLVGIRDENVEVRMASAKSLGQLGDESLVERLIHTLNESNEYLRAQTLDVLVGMGALSVSPLINSLKSNTWMLQYCAVKALARIKDSRSIKALIELLEDDTNVYVQKEAIEALEKLGEQAEEDLNQALEQKAWYVKEKIARILARTGSEQSMEKLKKAIEDEEDLKIKERLGESLKSMKVRFKINEDNSV
ncbi:MAG TPA: HEAT repeat domain-containing protein [Candidatus Eremiobacteraeota bacterium]|nr:HEAT repeat domain-containing protein [Candidatus Eremiobacteraeota bacterium]